VADLFGGVAPTGMQNNATVSNSNDLFGGISPEQYDQNKTQPQNEMGFLNKLPRNILSGLAQGGSSSLGMLKPLQNRLTELTSGAQQAGMVDLSPFAQEGYANLNPLDYLPSKDFDYSKAVGLPEHKTLSDKAIQASAKYAPEAIAGVGIARAAAPLLFQRSAAAPLIEASRLAEQRGLQPIRISEPVLNDIEQYLPNTQPYRNLMSRARQGGYQDLFELQSDLRKIGVGHSKNPFSFAERSFGREALRTRDRLLTEKLSALEAGGQEDIAALNRLGRDQYRRYARFAPIKKGIIGALAIDPAMRLLGLPSPLKSLTKQIF